MLNKVGIHDNFFELGGHSLLAIRVISAVRRELKVELSIKELFIYSTIAALATHLHTVGKGALFLPSIEAVSHRPVHIPLSFNQEQLWFIDQLEGSTQYHVPAVWRLKGELNKEALEYALKSVLIRHEVLHTVILEEEGKAYQYVIGTEDWRLEIVDGSLYTRNQEGLKNNIQELIGKPFDLSKDYMVRGHLITLSGCEHLLLVTLHHIASDGWSTSIIVKEVVELYAAYIENRPAQLAPLEHAICRLCFMAT
ncbi:MAG: condensation domain-containing protein [Chitinophagaceae bacterium]